MTKLVSYFGVQHSSASAFFCRSDLYFTHFQGFPLVQLAKEWRAAGLPPQDKCGFLSDEALHNLSAQFPVNYHSPDLTRNSPLFPFQNMKLDLSCSPPDSRSSHVMLFSCLELRVG